MTGANQKERILPNDSEKINGRTSPKAVPASVYRLQFGPHLHFLQAAEIVPYLKKLGIDTVYCSPFFKTPPGSLHGYNIIDSNVINPELGGERDYRIFCEALGKHGMGQILDLVPNHVGIFGGNELWNDVLENGPFSLYADFFDIEWNPRKRELRGKVLLPVLGDRYGAVLERGELRLVYSGGAFSIRYWEHSFPVAPTTYPDILESDLQSLKSMLGADEPDFLEFLSILSAFKSLSDHVFVLCENFDSRHRCKEDTKQRLHALCVRNDIIAAYVHAREEHFNSDKSYDLLDALLNAQFFRLAYWRVAAEEINYRRFFDVNELAAIKIENDRVLDFHHRKVFDLIREGLIQGLRIDHPDGLYDPGQYFLNLQKKYLHETAAPAEAEALSRLSAPALAVRVEEIKKHNGRYPLYIIIEKILDRRESLPEDWKVSGTVGYAFLNALNGLFLNEDAAGQISRIYENYAGMTFNVDELCYQKKKLFALVHMASEVSTLGSQLAFLSERNRHTRDFTKYNLTVALREVIACYPVYRTYMTPECETPSAEDQKFIQIAVARAKRYTPSIAPSTYDFIEDVLLLRFEKNLGGQDRFFCREFVMRFQQLTGPVMAKGVEDTVFYLYNRMLSLNEVGGDLGHFGYSLTEFHRQNHERSLRWPYNFLTSDTHDTKRSEDVRLRIDALSEIPDEWEDVLAVWTRLHEKFRVLLDGEFAPVRNTQYLIYQSLVGGWPEAGADMADFRDRFQDYIVKAMREAKSETNWINPNAEYEKAVHDFIDGILAQEEFLQHFRPFQKRVAEAARNSALSAWVIKLGSPGVVDVYQGSEYEKLCFVDPDNRRPVDFSARMNSLERIQSLFAGGRVTPERFAELLAWKEDALLKQYFFWRGLTFRRSECDIFLKGEYHPLDLVGDRRNYGIAFLRRYGQKAVLFLSGRFFMRSGAEPAESQRSAFWGKTLIHLPEPDAGETWTDVFTGRSFSPVRLDEGGKGFYLADLFQSTEAVMLCNFSDRG